jgi:hypothetical protein
MLLIWRLSWKELLQKTDKLKIRTICMLEYSINLLLLVSVIAIYQYMPSSTYIHSSKHSCRIMTYRQHNYTILSFTFFAIYHASTLHLFAPCSIYPASPQFNCTVLHASYFRTVCLGPPYPSSSCIEAWNSPILVSRMRLIFCVSTRRLWRTRLDGSFNHVSYVFPGIIMWSSTITWGPLLRAFLFDALAGCFASIFFSCLGFSSFILGCIAASNLPICVSRMRSSFCK